MYKLFKNKFINYKYKNTIFCIVRKKFYIFSYEELLRQKIILYLIFKKMYNIYNIYVEQYLYIKNKIYIIDILIIKKKLPYLIIECKTPKKKINYSNINQLLQYCTLLNAKYSFLTNGIDNIILKIKKDKIIFIKDIPKNF